MSVTSAIDHQMRALEQEIQSNRDPSPTHKTEWERRWDVLRENLFNHEQSDDIDYRMNAIYQRIKDTSPSFKQRFLPYVPLIGCAVITGLAYWYGGMGAAVLTIAACYAVKAYLKSRPSAPSPSLPVVSAPLPTPPPTPIVPALPITTSPAPSILQSPVRSRFSQFTIVPSAPQGCCAMTLALMSYLVEKGVFNPNNGTLNLTSERLDTLLADGARIDNGVRSRLQPPVSADAGISIIDIFSHCLSSELANLRCVTYDEIRLTQTIQDNADHLKSALERIMSGRPRQPIAIAMVANGHYFGLFIDQNDAGIKGIYASDTAIQFPDGITGALFTPLGTDLAAASLQVAQGGRLSMANPANPQDFANRAFLYPLN